MKPYVWFLRAWVASMVFFLCMPVMNVRGAEFPEFDKLPAQPELPDPLIMLNGDWITARRQWLDKRRPELKAVFQHYMYGSLAPKPEKIDFKVEGTYDDFLDGKATLKLVTISFGSPDAPKIDLMMVAPKHGKKLPVFLALNFCGNHAITTDPRIPLTRGWLSPNCKGCTNNHATEASRGSQANDWPLDEIV